MTNNPNLNAQQFPFLSDRDHEILRVTGRTMAMMRPSELVQHADGVLGDDERDATLAESIARRGYRAKGLPLHEHIHLVHHDAGANLANGNHRVRGLYSAGYDKPVPVLVSDRRSSL